MAIIAHTLFALIILCFPFTANAAEVVGSVVAMDGSADVLRGGSWRALEIGAGIQVGDRLRTGDRGRLRISLRDESTVSIAEGTELVVDEQVFDVDQSPVRTLLRLLGGKIRSLVSEYYSDPLAQYDVETVTAVSGVRGTDFVVTHDPATDLSEVIVVSGEVTIHSTLDRTARGVRATAKTLTTIAKGAYPSEPRPLTDAELQGHLEAFELIGGGAAESLLLDSPVLRDEVPREDRAGEAGQGLAGRDGLEPPGSAEKDDDRKTPSDLLGQPPEVLDAFRQERDPTTAPAPQ